MVWRHFQIQFIWGYGGVAFGNITEGDETMSPPHSIHGKGGGATHRCLRQRMGVGGYGDYVG